MEILEIFKILNFVKIPKKFLRILNFKDPKFCKNAKYK